VVLAAEEIRCARVVYYTEFRRWLSAYQKTRTNNEDKSLSGNSKTK